VIRSFFLTAVAGASLLSPVAAQEHGTVVQLQIETSLGTIHAEVYPDLAPVTVENFLAYVDDALFDGGSFFRSVRIDNQPNDSVLIDVIQGGPDGAATRGRLRDPIALERTSDTGLRHTDGTLSMARAGPDTARSQFFVCIGEQPALDFGGHRNPDGQGFAAFGRVTEGMDIVRQIQGGALEGQRLVEPIRIESIRRRP
jgi:peptidyl-prolyl cis-trans isomerase A (cyclophilin A)